MKNHLLIGAAVVVALMGCSSKKSQFESQFMDGCAGKNGGREQKKICSCVIEELETHHSIDELTALAQQQPQRLMLETVSYARDCGTK
jgi:hypothetical protein